MSLAIRVGPIVRYVDASSATIWLELDLRCSVVATAKAVRGMMKPAEVVSSVAHSVEVGLRHYALIRFTKLKPATLYTYSITGAPDNGAMRSPSEVRRSKSATRFDLAYCSYGNTPTFRTLPEAGKEPLRFAFGSCRNFEGGFDGSKKSPPEPDIFSLYGEHLFNDLKNRLTSWPHVVLLIGDQIYADNVAQSAQKKIEQIAKRPKLTTMTAVTPKQLDTLIAGGVLNTRNAGAGGFQCYWFQDFAKLYELSWTTDASTQLLLANVPMFMLPDDHEFTDDFNISGSWIKQALADPDWKHALIAGMTAYWVYQGWGNVDEATASSHPVLSILENEHKKDAQAQIVDIVTKQLQRTLHVPAYYVVPTTPPIIMADTRTDRQFVAPTTDKQSTDSATVIVHSHRDDHIMSDTQFDWLKDQVTRATPPIIATSVPLLQAMLADRLLSMARPEVGTDLLRHGQDNSDGFEFNLRDADADTWFAFPRSVARILEILAPEKEIYWLAGDVHFSYLFDVTGFAYRDTKGTLQKTRTRLVQIVSSPFRKEIDDKSAVEIYKLGGVSHRDDQGQPDAFAGMPASNDLRDPFGLPRDIWPATPKNRFPDKRYGTLNNIAVVRLGTAIQFLGANPQRLGGASPTVAPLVELAKG